MMLHTVNKSPFERNALASCLNCVLPGAAILLIEDGVYGAVRGTPMAARVEEAMKSVSVYALQPDVEARGMSERLLPGVKLVGYDGFVDLAAAHANVQSWL